MRLIQWFLDLFKRRPTTTKIVGFKEYKLEQELRRET